MPRDRGADNKRTESRRRRGEHSVDAKKKAEQPGRRGNAHFVAEPTTDSFQLFLNQAAKHPLLTREEEVELAQAIERGDLAAKEKLINSNLRLVIKFARNYQGHGLSLQDLVQEAMLGLIRATEKFDWRRGYKFSTYAVLWIKQAIQRGLDNTGRQVRIPAHVAQRERTVNRITAELTTQLDRDPTDEEVAQKSQVDIDDVRAVRDLTRVTTSLDTPVGEDGDTTLGELKPDESLSFEEEIAERDRELAVSDALTTLPDAERRVLQMRFGTGGEETASLRDVARELGVTQEGARQIEARGLQRLASSGSLEAWRDQ
ncbi:MAG: sigma-70 family RNA polymerase sigma factor [Solirubrobacterales bacterium]|nr:sigma-70 family RNA polymerase sigma factor [Solirubrobacterales bacterium]